jgi:hypothetical protein
MSHSRKCPQCPDGWMGVETSRPSGDQQARRMRCRLCGYRKWVLVPADSILRRQRRTVAVQEPDHAATGRQSRQPDRSTRQSTPP